MAFNVIVPVEVDYIPALGLDGYRERVRTIPCSFCGARREQPCTYFNDPSNTTDRSTLVELPYVHDDRSFAYEQMAHGD